MALISWHKFTIRRNSKEYRDISPLALAVVVDPEHRFLQRCIRASGELQIDGSYGNDFVMLRQDLIAGLGLRVHDAMECSQIHGIRTGEQQVQLDSDPVKPVENMSPGFQIMQAPCHFSLKNTLETKLSTSMVRDHRA